MSETNLTVDQIITALERRQYHTPALDTENGTVPPAFLNTDVNWIYLKSKIEGFKDELAEALNPTTPLLGESELETLTRTGEVVFEDRKSRGLTPFDKVMAFVGNKNVVITGTHRGTEFKIKVPKKQFSKKDRNRIADGVFANYELHQHIEQALGLELL